jgi:hypothetical protein
MGEGPDEYERVQGAAPGGGAVNGSTVGDSRLLRRLIRIGLMAERCQICGRARWRCRRIPLELDHINGEPTDNRFENLRVLCPNCHAQTETYCGRNRKPA